MLSREDNERITRVGPETPMGKTMRRYWIPALLSWELPEPDCPPVRVKLLGEELVAFRTTDGNIGMLEEFCAHRRASLWLGRNEENGLRCVYHGWKYDSAGNCVEQMNEPREFASKVKITAYPTFELAGVIWTYMGAAEKQPPPPLFAWTQVPETHRAVSKAAEECNWLQALEGGIDTSHFTIMHRALKSNPRQAGVDFDGPGVQGGKPDLAVDITDYGYAYFGIRPLPDDQQYVRGYHFIMPFSQLRPAGPDREETHGHYWVPIDDDRCMVWNFYYSHGEEPVADRRGGGGGGGNSYETHVDVENGFRSIRNSSNDWMIDRDMQKTETFTGIEGINQQDRAVQESMGPIVDRSKEHLGPADKAIIATRKLLLEAVDVVEAGGDPAGTSDSYHEVVAAEDSLPNGRDWREKLLPRMYRHSMGRGAASRADAAKLEKTINEESETHLTAAE